MGQLYRVAENMAIQDRRKAIDYLPSYEFEPFFLSQAQISLVSSNFFISSLFLISHKSEFVF
jgi:hypothetical protein